MFLVIRVIGILPTNITMVIMEGQQIPTVTPFEPF
jgi:hypothetical protein